MKIGGGLWQNSGGELKLYLGRTGSTIAMGLVDPSFLTPGRGVRHQPRRVNGVNNVGIEIGCKLIIPSSHHFDIFIEWNTTDTQIGCKSYL